MARTKESRSKITLHMVCSLDGYIAKNDGNVDWMLSQDSYDQQVLSGMITQFLKTNSVG